MKQPLRRNALVERNATIEYLQGQVRELREHTGHLIDQIRQMTDQQTSLQQDLSRKRAAYEAHTIVLQGDRDALTRVVEVLSRRLASPAADHDPSRGGWRSANKNMAVALDKAGESWAK